MAKALRQLKLPHICGQIIGDLCKQIEITSHKKGECLYHLGDHATRIYYLAIGKIKLFFPEIDFYSKAIVGLDGPEQVIVPGDSFAYESWCGGHEQNETAMVIEDSTLISISRAAYSDVVDEHERHKSAVLEFILSEIPTIMLKEIKDDEEKLSRLCRNVLSKQYSKNHVIIRKGKNDKKLKS